jgi:hypothetical protein
MFAAGKTAAVSGAGPDDKFNYVTMLLHGDGTNGAQNNTFLDSGPSTFSITRNGNTTQGSFSPYGSNWSNYFDGFGDYLSIANNAALNMGTGDFTVEAWINISNIDFRCIICLGQYNNGAGVLRITNSGNLQWYWNDASFIVTSSTTVTVGVWSHVAVVRLSGTTKLYINGTNSGSGSDSNSYSSTYPTWVGSENQGSVVSPFHGNISNVRVVKGTAVYTSNFTPPTSALTAISGTSLLTCQANRFLDASSNAFAVTRNGDTSVQRFNPFGTSTAYSTSVIGGSGYFDGSGDYLSTPANSANLGTGDFSITFWLYCTVDPVNSVVATNVYNSAAFTDGWYIQCGDKTVISFGIGSAGGADGVSSPAGINLLSQWNYVEATRSGSTVRVFVNGVSGTTKTITSNGTKSGNNTKIGSRYDGSAVYLPGYITDFKVVIGTAGNTSNYTPPTAPASATGSNLLLSMQNGAIFDNAMMNDLETVGNAQISTSVKKYGTGSLYFDGTGDYLLGPSTPNVSFGAGDFTIEAWVYRAASPGNNQSIFQKGRTADSNLEFSMILSGSNFLSCFYTTDGSTVAQPFSSTTAVPLNTWTHIAITRSGSTWRCFVNGTLEATTTAAVTLYTGAGLISSGANPIGDNPLTGYIDELRITKGYARYTATFTPPTAAFPNTGPY